MPTRQNEVVGLFVKAFANYVRDVTRLPFPTSKHLYACIYVIDQAEAQLIISDGKPSDAFLAENIELASYTDIPMIPLMDVGITASKLYNA
ncbi:hypothetical protein nACB1_079 [Acinetobacter phage nACB1]|nr:hypothetical protein nACB1_079 [Acinetobacter phage nACB1]